MNRRHGPDRSRRGPWLGALMVAVVLGAAGCARESRNDESGSPAASQADSAPRAEPLLSPDGLGPQRSTKDPRRPQPIGGGSPSGDMPLPVFRASEVRRRFDEGPLERVGIRRYESRRLRLYTDLEPAVARSLPPIIDAAYAAWEAYFGPLPPNREGTEFQITGYLMRDPALFRETGLLPPGLPPVVHGLHRGAEFWMNDQRSDYYRRHLMIHEATHCFMAATRDERNWPPAWYAEGMAELFGTHRIDPDGSVRFRVMPHNESDFLGQGRIRVLRQETEQGGFKPVRDVLQMPADDYLRAYAWSWGLCAFLDGHPRYRERFRELGEHIGLEQFLRAVEESFREDWQDLETEWALFVHNLEEGYDLERAAVEFQEGVAIAHRAQCRVAADRGWQSSGVRVEAGEAYEIAASGRFTLADHPAPWISEPQGVSLRYANGRPLGELHAAIHGSSVESLLEVVPIGRGAVLRPAVGGTLYFRVNDAWSELEDNQGHVEIQVQRLQEGG